MKNLLGIEQLTKDEIFSMFDSSLIIKNEFLIPRKSKNSLQGKTIVLFFVENSTRTLSSFELAAKRLNATTIRFTTSSSSITKGETLLDTMKVLEAMKIDGVVMRHSSSCSVKFLSDRCNSVFINAGDGSHEHPTQALLDGLTLYEKWGKNVDSFKGKKIVIIGDISHSRVARSNILMLNKLGAQVGICAPPTLIPMGINNMGVVKLKNINDSIEFADCLMFLRIQRERQDGAFFPSLGEYSKYFGLNKSILHNLKSNQYILHPGPVSLGVELDLESETSNQSLILNQVENGVAVRMSILETLLES